MSQDRQTFCRICEPMCPIIAGVNDSGQVTSLRPNKKHPVSRGYACHKGLSYLEVHNDPDRVNTPLRRTNSRADPVGLFEAVSWDDAFNDIGQRLRRVLAERGPDAIATYVGNPMAFNSNAFMKASGFACRIGSKRSFSAGTQDVSNKPVACDAMFGSSQMAVPDLEHTRYLLCLGANPKVSHWTILSTHRPSQGLRDIVARGGKVCFINPRRIESSGPSTGETILIKPDTDLYLLAAILNEIDAGGGFDEGVIRRYGRRVTELRAFTAEFSIERVARVTGIDARKIRDLAGEFAAADGASAYMSTGVNQGRQGTLAYWLLTMLNFVTGNLGRKGGTYYARGVLDTVAPGSVSKADHFMTPLGEMRLAMGYLPGCTLPDFINLTVDPVRAFLVFSGNPLLSMPGEARMRQAFEKLDLMVTVDLFRNATAEYADYILPAADWLEREDINLSSCGFQTQPYVQYADAVVSPQFERRNDCWIISRIERELDLENAAAAGPEDCAGIDAVLAPAGLTCAALAAMPEQTAVLPQPAREDFFDAVIRHADGRVDCCPEVFAEAIGRSRQIFNELEKEPQDQLKLISLRTNYMHNSSLSNMKSLKRLKYALNPLHINPRDAGQRGLAEGDFADIWNDHGSISVQIVMDATLRPGVVALSHGYGHQQAPGISRAKAFPGVNVNRLMPTGRESYDKLSNMAHLTGIVVKVKKTDVDAARNEVGL